MELASHDCRKVRNGRTVRVLQFVDAAFPKHKGNYCYCKSVWRVGKKSIAIVCYRHGLFNQSPYEHLRGSGCKKCYDERRKAGSGKLTFVDRSNDEHGEGTYLYDEAEYVDNDTPLKIKCTVPGHKPFWQTPRHHINAGQGCPTCHSRVLGKDKFVEKSKLKNGNKCGYDAAVYVNIDTLLTLTCLVNPDHKPFEITPRSHFAGNGCPACGRINKGKHLRKSEEWFIMMALLKNGDSCFYTLVVYVNSKTKVILICRNNPEHGRFLISPDKHLAGYGCQKCSSTNTSRPAMEWLAYMSIKLGCHIQHSKNEGEYQIPGTKYHADGYSKKINMVFEFHGDYWHGNPKVFSRDAINKKTGMTFGHLYDKTIARQACIEAKGFQYVCIWESEWNELKRATHTLQKLWRAKRDKKIERPNPSMLTKQTGKHG